MKMLLGHDVAVAEWIGNRIGDPIIPPYTALGWLDDDGTLAVGFVFFGYVPGGNIEMGLAATGKLTRGILSAVADYVFRQAGAKRITARCKRRNTKAHNMLKRAGFVQECVCRDYYHDDDAVQFRLTKSGCKWLKEA
jgi:RimJ/RimL family protein N-acetyltransferase